MKLSQFALVAALTTAGHAFALEAMSDSTLSSTTGRDGITIKVNTPANGLQVNRTIIHDKDGITGAYTGATMGAPGAIVLDNLKLTSTGLTLKVDADGNASSKGALLNIDVGLGDVKLSTGDISVAKSNRAAGAPVTTKGIDAATKTNPILNNMDIAINGASLNIQLGNEAQSNLGNSAQTALINASGTINGGLRISNLQLNDLNGTDGTDAGSIKVKDILVTNSNGPDLTLNAGINATKNGLSVALGGGDMDVMLAGVNVGGAGDIGDIELSGIKAAGTTLTITGH